MTLRLPRPPPPNSRLLYQNRHLLRIILKALLKWNHRNEAAKTTKTTETKPPKQIHRKDKLQEKWKILKYEIYGKFVLNFKTIGEGCVATQRTLTTLAQNTNLFTKSSLLLLVLFIIDPPLSKCPKQKQSPPGNIQKGDDIRGVTASV